MRVLLDRGDRVNWNDCPLAQTPAANYRVFRKPASRIFQGISWNVSRPDFGFAKRVGWSDVTKAFEGYFRRERSLALAASQRSH